MLKPNTVPPRLFFHIRLKPRGLNYLLRGRRGGNRSQRRIEGV